jgi:hypothetical protein
MDNKTFVKFQFDNPVEAQIKEAPIKEDNHDKVNQLIANEMLGYQDGNLEGKYSNEIICSHCLKPGHIIKTCPSAVVSYGLICYHQKQIIVDASGQTNNFFNKRTKKQGFTQQGNNNSNYRKGHNLPRIKILKRNETLNHTLKNMLGLTSAENELDSLVSNNYINCNNTNTNNTNTNIENDSHNYAHNELDENNLHENDNDNETENDNFSKQERQTKQVNIYKAILVQRRNTIGFIEFMRGKYEVNNHEYIIKLFNMLSFDEKRILRQYEAFDAIRKIIGLGRENIYKREYDDAKIKFEALRNHADGNMIFKLLDRSITRWNSPEWGIPKGRRKIWMPHSTSTSTSGSGEIDIDCAVREFVEETGIKYKNLIVYRNVKALEELYKGINGVLYKHVYYLAMVKDTEEARANVENVEKGGQYNFEISNVKCFGLSECHRIIRPYYVSKLNVIKKGFQLINCINHYFE